MTTPQMTLPRAREILWRYQRELDAEARRRIVKGVERPIDLLTIPEDKQLLLATRIVSILEEHGFEVP